MIVSTDSRSGLGAFSLSNLLKSVAGAVVRGTQVTVPTPTGQQTYDLGNPSHVKALESLIAGVKIGKAPAANGSSSSSGDLVKWGGIAFLAYLLLRR